MSELRPGKYFIACELNPFHRVLDLPSQYAHLEGGLVQAITGNSSEYQKWLIEPVAGSPEFFTIRSNMMVARFVEPLRIPGERSRDEILLGFYAQTDSPFQHWRFEPAHRENTFYILNAGSGKYWDLREQDPSHIQQLFKKDMPHQHWILQTAG
jgi:hypothetical protein